GGDSPAGTVRTDERGDAWLVEQVRGGDDHAFAALVVRYERKLIRVLTRLVHDEELARDLAQETFWKVYTRLDRFDTARRFGPWLFRIGVNLGLDLLRRHEGPPASSIDRIGRDGRRPFDLPDPDPRLRAELVQEVHFILDRIEPRTLARVGVAAAACLLGVIGTLNYPSVRRLVGRYEFKVGPNEVAIKIKHPPRVIPVHHTRQASFRRSVRPVPATEFEP